MRKHCKLQAEARWLRFTHPRMQVFKSIKLYNEEKVAVIQSFMNEGMMSLTSSTNSSLCHKTFGRVWTAALVENGGKPNGSS